MSHAQAQGCGVHTVAHCLHNLLAGLQCLLKSFGHDVSGGLPDCLVKGPVAQRHDLVARHREAGHAVQLDRDTAEVAEG